MRRHFGHGLAMSTKTPIGLQGSQPLQQVSRLGKGRCRRLIEPFQLAGHHPPTGQLQGQPGEVGLKDFGAAVGCQLLVLGL
ncbi:hypothetical protein D3C86_2111290 [compost metagenome]